MSVDMRFWNGLINKGDYDGGRSFVRWKHIASLVRVRKCAARLYEQQPSEECCCFWSNARYMRCRAP